MNYVVHLLIGILDLNCHEEYTQVDNHGTVKMFDIDNHGTVKMFDIVPVCTNRQKYRQMDILQCPMILILSLDDCPMLVRMRV